MATGQDIVDEVRAEINDEDVAELHWSDADMLRYVNAAQRRIVILVPEANVVEETFTVINNDIRQVLPAGGIKFLDVDNYDATNAVRGPRITQVEYDAMNSSHPTWGALEQYATKLEYPDAVTEYVVSQFDHYAHDPRDPKAYHLFPATTSILFEVLLKYVKVPTVLATLAGTFALADKYRNPAKLYIRYRTLETDTRYSAGSARRTEAYSKFLSSLGIQDVGNLRVDPNNPRPPGDSHG